MFTVGKVRMFTSSSSFFCSSLDLSDSNHIIDTLSTSIDYEQSSSFLNPSLEDEVNAPAKNIDYRNFKFEMYVRKYPWLYYNPVEKGYKCIYCELFLRLEVAIRSISLENRL